MAGNAWGADWGRYHRQKSEKKSAVAARKKRTPCVYLLYKVDGEREWFGEPVLLVKVGKSERNVLQRYSEQKSKGFVIASWWSIDLAKLHGCELEILRKCKERYGEPVEGNEVFRVSETIGAVKELIEGVVKEFGYIAL